MYRRPAPEEFLADPDLMARIVHPDDRATYVAHVANVVCHDDIDLELRIVRADGDVRWISHHCVPIHDTDGRLLGRQGTNHHITERKQSEAVAKRSEAIVQSSEDAIISKTLDGIVTSWNPGAEAIFGFGNGEMIGKTKLALFPPELLNEETAILERIRGGETVEHIETQRLRKDGKRIDVSVTISPIRDDVGNVVGASKIARDITERKLQNIALIASERRFHDIVSASGDSA